MSTVLGCGSNSTTTGGGADIITLGTGADTVNSGAGGDTIIVASANLAATDSVDGGAGTDLLKSQQMARLSRRGALGAKQH